MKLTHIIESQQFNVPMLMELFELTHQMEKIAARGGTQDYHNKIMGLLFYEPSTRTRFSFETAMLRLGGKVLSTERAREFSSFFSSDSLEDAIRVVSQFVNVLVLRHIEMGSAKRASLVSSVPIINAGDGMGQHPTQALLELYTIYKELNHLDGVLVALVGNLKEGRTARSLSYLLGKFDRVKIYFVAPQKVQIGSDICDYLERHNIWYEKTGELDKVLSEVDVVYMTRIEKEKLSSTRKKAESTVKKYQIDKKSLQKLPQKSIILHPLPRLHEIDPAVDTDPRAVYFKQVQYGVHVRMALLATIFQS